MYIIDEISANLYMGEYQNIWDQIETIKNSNNPVLLVEYEDFFIRKCVNNIKMGPRAGINGGRIVEKNSYVAEKKNIQLRKRLEVKELKHITDITINNIRKLNLDLPKGVLSILCGKSGSENHPLQSF